jgi:hypothetical protein
MYNANVAAELIGLVVRIVYLVLDHHSVVALFIAARAHDVQIDPPALRLLDSATVERQIFAGEDSGEQFAEQEGAAVVIPLRIEEISEELRVSRLVGSFTQKFSNGQSVMLRSTVCFRTTPATCCMRPRRDSQANAASPAERI